MIFGITFTQSANNVLCEFGAKSSNILKKLQLFKYTKKKKKKCSYVNDLFHIDTTITKIKMI